MEHSSQRPNLVRTSDLARREHANKVTALKSRSVIFRKAVNFVLSLFLVGGVLPATAGAPQETRNSNLLSIAELQNLVTNTMQSFQSFRVEGIVRAIVPQQNMLVLQDASAAALLELPSVGPSVRVGDWLAVEGDHCPLARTRQGIQAGMDSVVDDDGIHSALEKSGSVFLSAGMNPIRVTWFNSKGEFALNLEYKGPEVPKQKVPASSFWHGRAGETNQDILKPGVHYRAYEGNDWQLLPDFSQLIPVAEGDATNFSLTYRTRDEDCGLAFDGFIQIGQPGLYTFYLTSDDGARLYAGKSSVSCKVIASPGTSVPAPESIEKALANRGCQHWIELEGEVAFVSQNGQGLEIELVVGGNYVPVTVIDGKALFGTNLLHRWIRADGICEFARDPEDKKPAGIFVPGSEQIKISQLAEGGRGHASNDRLTTAVQVRRLNAEEASKHIPTKIRGVVIYSSPTSIVLQDSSGGVFVSTRAGPWAARPDLGELWEIEGTTDPGDFSPVIVADTAKFLGDVALPEPIRPTRDQLMNGNLDAEYGELHGVLTGVSNTEMTLLTPDGKVTVVGNGDRPLPNLPASVPSGGSLLGSVVRIRGCFAPMVDLQTRQVVPGKIYLYPALVEVEDPPPLDPFRLPLRKAADLMWFDARASALQRTRLTGQIIHALPGEYFLMDGGIGFRVFANDPSSLQTGDLIEAVGFPKLGGPSPVLQDAQIRETGHAALPNPVKISAEGLLDRKHDSTLVQVEAMLISDTLHQDEHMLELQSGPRHFVARLKSDPRGWTSLRAGCRLQLTGVYASADEDEEHLGVNLVPFELLLNNAASIRVLQQPPWWTVQRAIVVMAALVGVLGVTFIWVALLRRTVEERTTQLKREIEERQIVEQHHAVERERTRVAQDLHDELGAGLTEVSILGSLANTPAVPPQDKSRYLDQLTHKARSLVISLDEIVWAVNPHYDSVASLASYFSLFAESFLNLAGITCRLRVMDDIPEYPLDSMLRHGIFCAFKEALNNVIRHSGATEVQLIFEVVGDQLVLSVIDNGGGFEFVAESPGKDGLAGLCQRMQQLGGDCQITSQPGHGTKVQIRLPLNQAQYGQSRNR
jgi:signal transduction histidine kinase